MKVYKNTTTGVAWTYEEIKTEFEQFRSEIEESKGKSYSDFEEYLDELVKDGELREAAGGKYTVLWVGGERDGETLGICDNLADAINFANNIEQPFDENVNYGIAIIDADGEFVEW